MKKKQVDVRGLACPEPVVRTRQAINEPGVDRVTVLVNAEVPAQNIERMVADLGWNVKHERQGGEIRLTLTKGEKAETCEQTEAATCTPAGRTKVVVFIASNLLGTGEEELGRVLMRAFIKTLRELDPRPGKIIFANSGVQLTTKGSDLIKDIRSLEAEGVTVLSCGTCLDYYGLVDSLAVGASSNMFEIVSALVEADRVVRP